jgi:hypothetical protein
MPLTLDELREKVFAQKERIPSLYGDVDFSRTPERFTTDLNVRSSLARSFERKYRADILADGEAVERARLYTLLGDTVADAYAALVPEYGMGRLIAMLKQACDEGLEAVDNPPRELVDFIREMETVPDWLDMSLVNEGARVNRNIMANLSPFAIRGAFVATFMNKYSGLPMALTGALSGDASVRRVNETASFFTTASLPGALERFGAGFKAAAMVRLMHSMVRFNLLRRSRDWDVDVYGIPVPQVDQMPAGTMSSFINAISIVRKGGNRFTAQQRAVVELNRYQSYLLGLPDDLLPATPKEIFDVMMVYSGTLRDGYDDDTCGELVRSTMAAYMPKEKDVFSRIFNQAEKSFSKVLFTRVFLGRSEQHKAERMGMRPSMKDYALFSLVNAWIWPQFNAHMLAQRLPVLDRLADRRLVKKLNALLVEYGHAEYVTDINQYRTVS